MKYDEHEIAAVVREIARAHPPRYPNAYLADREIATASGRPGARPHAFLVDGYGETAVDQDLVAAGRWWPWSARAAHSGAGRPLFKTMKLPIIWLIALILFSVGLFRVISFAYEHKPVRHASGIKLVVED